MSREHRNIADETANILIVDDSPDNLRLLAGILEDQGYDVRPASSGSRALEAVRAERPDLILLDIKMPDISGYDLCEQLKADEGTRDIPIIFISALQDMAEKVKGFALGGGGLYHQTLSNRRSAGAGRYTPDVVSLSPAP